MFDVDTLTMSMNYQPVFTGNQTNDNAGSKANIDARQARKKTVHGLQYVLLPLLTSDSQGPMSLENKVVDDARKKSTKVPRKENGDSRIFSGAYDDKVEGVVADFNNLELTTVYLQNEYYALWEVIEFDDSYKAPLEKTAKDKGLAGKVYASTKKKGRTVAITAEDMQKRKNDVKARTNLLLALPDEHQLQAIISYLEFMDVPIKQDDLNQKFFTSPAPEWLVYTIVWRNRDDLDKMSLDDVYNHLKVYEPEIDDDDIEEMDIKWNLALLSMRAGSSGKSSTMAKLLSSVDISSGNISTNSGNIL
nr:hypothetical protein [Tanacetum cinerariifolium]